MRECGESQKVVEYLNFNSVDNFKKKSFRKKAAIFYRFATL